MKLVWNDKYSTGKVDVDADHMLLFKVFNELAKEIEIDNKSPKVKIYVKAIEDYTNTHFSKEEKTLKKLPKKIYREHIKEHKEFQKIINNLYKEIHNHGELAALYQVILFTGEWLLNHVQYTDKYHLTNRD